MRIDQGLKIIERSAMVTTPIEVIDSAVKIGLGALLAGLTGIFTAKASANQQWRLEKLRHRLAVIEKIAAGIGEAHQVVLRFGAQLGGAAGRAVDESISPGVLQMAQNAQKIADEELMPLHPRLQSYSEQIFLVADAESAEAIREYCVAITGLQVETGNLMGLADSKQRLVRWNERSATVRERHMQVLTCLKRKFDRV